MDRKNRLHSVKFSDELTVVHTDYRHKYKGARVTKEEHQTLVKAFTNHICFLMQFQVSLEQGGERLFWDERKNLCIKSDSGAPVVLMSRDSVVHAYGGDSAANLQYRFKYSLKDPATEQQ